MAKRQELRAISYISIGGAPPVRFDSLTPEKRAECVAKMCDNIGAALSSYCSAHPEEARALMKGE
ncbi:MAG: hypothetical protein K6G82_07625 [Ruminococcus sp.]|mgnify:CR=1 FL=1|jgi:hypothetical protein|nr:hypothetical protein [Ruminococcus sp.]